jgi:hypothetical protein
MNVMGETNFVDFLLCREGIPLFQDPALLRGFRRKPPSQGQRKQAPTTPDRRKKGQPEAATPIASNKNKKRRRPEDDIEDDDARPNPSHLTYNWESLGLGRTIGTAALNKRLCDGMRDEGGTDRVPQLSAIECLHAVQQLKLRTVLPPADSELHNENCVTMTMLMKLVLRRDLAGRRLPSCTRTWWLKTWTTVISFVVNISF